jgi:hypothetical protein
LLIWLWNHFEELVKLSQLLATDNARISLAIINNLKYLFSEDFKKHYQDTKKIIFIVDCKLNLEMISFLKSTFWKPIEFITPEWNKITSIFPEYYFEQTWFNAISLYERSRKLV